MLANLVVEDVPPEKKDEVIDALVQCRSCCLEPGVARHVRKCGNTRDEIKQSPAARDIILGSIAVAPSNNIDNEDRLARHRTHTESCKGRYHGSTAVSANHVLAECVGANDPDGKVCFQLVPP